MQRGSTALLIASLKGMTTTVAELLEKKADVNIRNEVIKSIGQT
jgi:ankyrin repeat protein